MVLFEKIKLVIRNVMPFFILFFALLLFVYPVFKDKTLTNFSTLYALSPHNQHAPKNWYRSMDIDETPIYLLNPADILNINLLKEHKTFAWNPYEGLGAPLLGAMQTAPYYPLKLITWLWPDYWGGSDILRMLLFLIAGWGNYLLLRSMGIRKPGALFAGLSYMLCEHMFVFVNMPPFLIISLLPMMLFSINKMLSTQRVIYALLAGLIGGSQFLGGFPETSFIFSLITMGFFFWILMLYRNNLNRVKTGLLLGLLATILTLALSGFQLGEFARYLSYSSHVHATWYGHVVKEPYYLISMFIANFFGKPFHSGLARDHMYLSLFCGISTVLLALFAICSKHESSPKKYLFFFLSIFIIFVGYDFGFPLLKNIGYLPLFERMSTAWNVFVIPFSLSVMAGFGLHALLNEGARRMVFPLVLYVLLTLFFWSHFDFTFYMSPTKILLTPVLTLAIFILGVCLIRKYPRVGVGILLALVVSEMYRCNMALKYLHFYHQEPITQPPSLEWLAKHVDHERILGMDGVYPSNTLNQYRIRDIRHFDAMYPSLYVDIVESIWPGARQNVYDAHHSEWKTFNDPLLHLAAVKYIVVPAHSDTMAPIQSLPKQFPIVYEDSDVTIFENKAALARVRFVTKIERAPLGFTPQDLKNSDENTTYLKGYTADLEPCAVSTNKIRYIKDDPDQIKLQVNTSCSGFLVLADMFYPGWNVSVDGHQSPIYQANYAFRAVKIDAGPHEVIFKYQPWTIRFGLPIAIASFVGLFLLGIFCWIIKPYFNSIRNNSTL